MQYLFLWASWGVGGVSKGVTFIHGGLATVGAQPEDPPAVGGLRYHWGRADGLDGRGDQRLPRRVKYAHPNGTQDPEERRVREDRTKRLNLAYEAIQKTRQGR